MKHCPRLTRHRPAEAGALRDLYCEWYEWKWAGVDFECDGECRDWKCDDE